MNYRMKNIGATASLYKTMSGIYDECLKDKGVDIEKYRESFDAQAEAGCDHFNDHKCEYMSAHFGDSICSIDTCPLRELFEEEVKALSKISLYD